MDKEKQKVRYACNFANLTNFEGGDDKIRIVKDERGNEIGFELIGNLTEFNVRNANGYNFKDCSYDKFVEGYLAKNRLNVPVNIKHNDMDFQHAAGIVKSLTKTDKGVEVVAYVPKWAYAYNWIKNAVKDGYLQGFSNYGPITDGYYDEENDQVVVNGFSLLHVALVELMGDATSNFKAANTVFEGFERKDNKMQSADEFMLNL